MRVVYDYSSLADGRRKRCIQLVAEGSPGSVAIARAIHPGALNDAAALRRVRELLAKIPAAAAARRETDSLDEQISAVKLEIAELQARHDELVAERSQRRGSGGPGGLINQIRLLRAEKSIVREVLGKALEAAGIK